MHVLSVPYTEWSLSGVFSAFAVELISVNCELKLCLVLLRSDNIKNLISLDLFWISALQCTAFLAFFIIGALLLHECIHHNIRSYKYLCMVSDRGQQYIDVFVVGIHILGGWQLSEGEVFANTDVEGVAKHFCCWWWRTSNGRGREQRETYTTDTIQ